MSKKRNNTAETSQSEERTSSWDGVIGRFNSLYSAYAPILPSNNFYEAFARASNILADSPKIQNRRIKAISALPIDYTKDQIGEFLRCPAESEAQLRQTEESLQWTNYPSFLIRKTYQDIPTYHYYSAPRYIEKDFKENDTLLREARLIDKFNKTLRPDVMAHKIAGQALKQGKVFYYPRYSVDKSHNKVNYAFMQQLPEDYCTIIGENSVSGYTVSFNMMYFLRPGTSVAQFGEIGKDNLFDPFLDDFNAMFYPPKAPSNVYYCEKHTVERGQSRIDFFPGNVNRGGAGNPRVFEQNDRWFYYVSLPVDKVWTFEIDDATPIVASPFSGLSLTYAQQSDYEEAQLTLLLSPLVKIFTGEIPYFDNNGTRKEDDYRLSGGGRALFETLFNNLMSANNTAGSAFFTAPVENIKSHDFPESANANEISESFNRYSAEKAGVAALLPATDDVKASQVAASEVIASRYTTAAIYPQFERMMTYIYGTFNLSTEFNFKMLGTIFTDADIRENAMKDLDKGDISAFFKLSALDNESWIDKVSEIKVMDIAGIMSMLQIPQTAYTQTAGENGRPKSDGITSDAKEKAVDAGNAEE